METVTFSELVVKFLITLFVVPVIGAVITGLDRRITARIQGRFGPPILQPVYDVLKLFEKESVILNRSQIVFVYLHLAFMITAILFILLGRDLLMVLFVQAFSTISLILGGMSVYSP